MDPSQILGMLYLIREIVIDLPCSGIAKKRTVYAIFFQSKEYCVNSAGEVVDCVLACNEVYYLELLQMVYYWLFVSGVTLATVALLLAAIYLVKKLVRIFQHKIFVRHAKVTGKILAEIAQELKKTIDSERAFDRYILEWEMNGYYTMLNAVLPDEYPPLNWTANWTEDRRPNEDVFLKRIKHPAGYWVLPHSLAPLTMIDFSYEYHILHYDILRLDKDTDITIGT